MGEREIELKLAVAPDHLAALRRHPWLASQAKGEPKTKSLHSIYFDTPDFQLMQAGVTLRVRAVDGGHVQTVKTAGTGSGGLFERGEWEAPLALPAPDPAHMASTGVGLLADDRVVSSLRPVFATRIERTAYVIEAPDGAWEVEVALDSGSVSTGNSSEPLSEVELELRRGQPACLFALARQVLDTVPARPMLATKSDHGYRLARGQDLSPIKAKAPPLAPHLSVREAFQTIGRACLAHLLANERSLLATGDGEAIHQMRVALRRLRSAVKVFAPALDDPALDQLKADLRWILAHLGPARDLDVFVAEIIDPVIAQYAADDGLVLLRGHWIRARDTALASAVAAVESGRFAHLVLALGEWLETGAWLKRANHRLDTPITEFALRRLGKSARKLLRLGHGGLERLSPEDLHAVRIQGKQVRYAGEFFASLVPRKQMKVFLAELAELQDLLGQLNDIAVAGPRLSARMPEASTAKAAGMVSGWHMSRRARLLRDAEQAWKRWRALSLPWE